jgi:acetylornithine deacetylase
MSTFPLDTPLGLLRTLIATQSFSGEESGTAAVLAKACSLRGLRPELMGFNVVVRDPNWDESKPVCLLCSHHDTVRPNQGYTRDPFEPIIEDGCIYGLGSNDAGASAVALLEAFTRLVKLPRRSHNLLLALVAEEETSGNGGIRGILERLPQIAVAVVGEPTCLQPAVAERGMLVIDGLVTGLAGHAAHGHTINPIPLAAADVLALQHCAFAKTSEHLGAVRVSVTQIEAGSQHNVVPAGCRYVVDVRVNDCYSNEEVLEALREVVAHSELTPRSLRHQSSHISATHPLVKAAVALGGIPYGSPTLSDQAALNCPSVKCGPGDSFRSHQADEYIRMEELTDGIEFYTAWLQKFLVDEVVG